MKKVILLLGFLLFTLTGFSQQTTDINSLKKFITKALELHVTNAIKGDAIATAAVFDNNATIVEGETITIGRDAINKLEEEMLKEMKIIKMHHTIDGLTIDEDYAFQLGQVCGKLKAKANNSEIEILNKYMASWKKQDDGSWRIHYFIYYP